MIKIKHEKRGVFAPLRVIILRKIHRLLFQSLLDACQIFHNPNMVIRPTSYRIRLRIDYCSCSLRLARPRPSNPSDTPANVNAMWCVLSPVCGNTFLGSCGFGVSGVGVVVSL